MPTMDMYSSVKRLMTTGQLISMVDASVDSYFDMKNNSSDFENYQLDNNVGFYVINTTSDGKI